MGITLLGVVLIFLSIGLNIQTAESCSCYPFHPQHQFCTSEIAILAEITSKEDVIKKEEKLIRYKIKILTELKGFNNAKGIEYVYTYQDGAMCGIKLDQGRYILTGSWFKDDGIKVGLCNLFKRWDILSLTQQENLRQTYKTGCNCMISTCFDSPCCPQSKEECMWKTSTPQSLEYACLKDSDGTCGWYRAGSKEAVDVMCKPKGWSIFSFFKKIFG